MRSLTIAILTTLVVGCGGGGGGSSPPPQQPTPPAPTVTATISTATALLNTPVTIDWSSTDATTCGIAELPATNLAASGSRQVTPSVAGQFTYTVQCTGSGGSSSKVVTLTVPALPAVTATISAAASPIGAPVTIAWSSTNATSCEIAELSATSLAANGSRQVTPSAAGQLTFTVQCTGAGGNTSKAVTLTVPAPPTVTATISSATSLLGTPVTITWVSTNAIDCWIAELSANNLAANGSRQVTPPAPGLFIYTVRCAGAGGSANQALTLSVPTPPTVSAAISSATSLVGTPVTITWSSTSATGCDIAELAAMSLPANGSSQVTPSAGGQFTYTVQCAGPGGIASSAVALSVPPLPTVTAALSSATSPIGTPVTLTWSTTNATSCGIAEFVAANLPPSGSRQITPSTAGQFTYTVHCTGSGGSASGFATLTVPPVPTVSLSANPTSLTAGGSVTLAWSSSGATACSASGGWSGAKQVSGGQTHPDILASTTFTLTCTGPGGSASADVSVNVGTQITSWLDVNVRGVKLWMSNNPPSLFDEYLGVPPDTVHYELWHDVLLQARQAGATDVMFQLSTGVMQFYNDNQYLATNQNPPDSSLLALANDARSLGLRVTVSFFTHVQNVITGTGCCDDRPNPSDPAQWLQNTRLRVLEHARLARDLNAYAMIFMLDETQHLVRNPALANQWIQLIRDVRGVYAGKITSGWWTLGSGDSITAIPDSVIHELDYLGIGLFPDLVIADEPDLPALCNAYHSDAGGNDVVAFVRGLSVRYGKRIWITDKAFHSFKGASYDEWEVFGTKPLLPDQDLQARLYDSFLAVMLREGQGWLEGVSFQNFNNLRDGANPWPPRYLDGPLSESPQHKLAETVLSDWWNGRRTTGC